MALVAIDNLLELEQAKEHADHITIERQPYHRPGVASDFAFEHRWVCNACAESGEWVAQGEVEHQAIRHALTEQNPGGSKS